MTSLRMSLRKPFQRGKHWYYELNRRRISLRTTDKSVAMRLFNEIKRLYLAGRLSELTSECRATLGEFEKEYLKWAEQALGHSTFRANNLALAKVVAHAGRSTRLDRLGPKTMDAIIAQCRGAKLSTASINVYIRHTRAVFNKAVDWGYVQANPFRRCKELPKDRRPPSYLAQADMARVMASIKDIDLRRLVAAYLATGRRRSELLALTWADVDLDAGKYYVRRSKTHLSAWFPINDTLRSILLAIGPGEGRIFARWEHPDTVSHRVKDALKKAGFGHLKLHDLRHSFAAAFVEAGGSLKALQDLLGHTEYRTTEIYAHVGDDHLRQEVNRVKIGPVDLIGVK